MNNFQRITASRETLAAFLGTIPAIETPWDDAFHRIYCSSCSAADCDDCRRPERDSPLWWLGLPAAEAVSGTMEERGRGFASDREAWAELKECIERTKQMHTDIEKVHKEMWSAVKDRNEDAFAALSQEFERSSRILAEEWAQTSALAKIAVISESND